MIANYTRRHRNEYWWRQPAYSSSNYHLFRYSFLLFNDEAPCFPCYCFQISEWYYVYIIEWKRGGKAEPNLSFKCFTLVEFFLPSTVFQLDKRSDNYPVMTILSWHEDNVNSRRVSQHHFDICYYYNTGTLLEVDDLRSRCFCWTGPLRGVFLFQIS